MLHRIHLPLTLALMLAPLLASASACVTQVESNGEGEGEGAEGEGEGEEGEGEEGEGEGEAGEGEEGEGEEGEGEGEEGEGEGEGEGEAVIDPPTPSGCIDDVTAGDHAYDCFGLAVDARIPDACLAPGCGLILELHGDTGDGLLIDGHLDMRALGEQHDYIVVAPTGPLFGFGFPGSTWLDQNDNELVDIVALFRDVFRVDPAKIHVTGFSRGAFVTWRLICEHADLFASAAPAGAGDGSGFGEDTCFSDGRSPSREMPILFLMGRTDESVGYASLTEIRDAAIDDYNATGPVTIASDANYTHDRWTNAAGVVFEVFDHAYETVSDGPFADARGHCIPGSLSDPYAAQYAIPCELPNAFTWGEEVIEFFIAHPM